MNMLDLNNPSPDKTLVSYVIQYKILYTSLKEQWNTGTKSRNTVIIRRAGWEIVSKSKDEWLTLKSMLEDCGVPAAGTVI